MSDERQHAEAVARDVLGILRCAAEGYELANLADLIMAERAGLLVLAEAAEARAVESERELNHLPEYKKERDAYRKAKAENDERWQLEAGDLRAKLAAADLDLKVMREDRDALLQRPLTCTLQDAIARAERAEAAAGQMRAALESTLGWLRWSDGACAVCEHMHCDCGADDVREAMRTAALATDAGRGYQSPEQVAQACAAARVEALEEAAQVCVRLLGAATYTASTIRALKVTP